jgi:hypothetical protein
MKYDKNKIEKLYQKSLSAARRRLASLSVAERREPNITGLNGWVYEQTIRHCLSKELIACEISPIMQEQVPVPLYRRAKIDLLVGRRVAVEIKARGIFGLDDARKHRRFRPKVEDEGWTYCYLTGSETHQPFRLAMEAAFGKGRAFFLDTQDEDDWERFVREVLKNYEAKP